MLIYYKLLNLNMLLNYWIFYLNGIKIIFPFDITFSGMGGIKHIQQERLWYLNLAMALFQTTHLLEHTTGEDKQYVFA